MPSWVESVVGLAPTSKDFSVALCKTCKVLPLSVTAIVEGFSSVVSSTDLDLLCNVELTFFGLSVSISGIDLRTFSTTLLLSEVGFIFSSSVCLISSSTSIKKEK